MSERIPGTVYYYDHKTVIVGDSINTVWEITTLETSCYGVKIKQSPSAFTFQFITSRKIEINPALKHGEIVQLTYRSEPEE